MDINFYKKLVEHSLEGYAYHEIITDSEGNGIDSVFLYANPAFEKATGLSRTEIVGKKATEVLSENNHVSYDWIGNYGELVLAGGSISFEQYVEPLGRWYAINVYGNDGYVVTNVSDITSYKQTERELVEYKASIEQLTDGIALVYMDGKIKFVNNAWAKMHGCSVKEPIGLHLNIFHTPEQIKNEVTPYIERLITTGKAEGEVGHMRVDGSIFPMLMTSSVIRGEDNKPIGMIGVARDITDRKQAEQALEEATSRLQVVSDNMLDLVSVTDLEGNYKFAGASHRILGYDVSTLIGKNVMDFVHPDDLPKVKAGFQDMLTNRSDKSKATYRCRCADGTYLWFETIGSFLLDEAKEPKEILFNTRDITDRKQAERALRESEERLHSMFDAVPDLISIHTSDMDIVYSNWNGLGGIPEDKRILQTKCYKTYRGLDDICPDCHAISVLQSKKPLKMEVERNDGMWVDIRVIPLKDEDDDVELFVEWVRDITERKQAEKEIEHLSFHDPLTGLYNRRFFDEELKRLDVPRNLPLTLMMLDVNGLKLTNDAFGHQAGNELLIRVARLLQGIYRADDIIARIGGDEFVVLLPQLSKVEGYELTKRIEQSVALEKVEGIPISVSCGLSTKTDQQEKIADVFKAAEDSMYQQKISERNSYRYQTIQLIMQTLYAKSPRERRHSERVSQLCSDIGSAMGLEGHEITTAGVLHDIGKVAISESILDKESPLTDGEWTEIKRHPEAGYSILSSVNDYGPLAQCVLAHHERWDGSGYPHGLKGEAIPLLARIIAIADSYDAMVYDRPYRKGMSHAEAMKEIQACAGFQFDPEVVKAFIEMMQKPETAGETSN